MYTALEITSVLLKTALLYYLWLRGAAEQAVNTTLTNYYYLIKLFWLMPSQAVAYLHTQ